MKVVPLNLAYRRSWYGTKRQLTGCFATLEVFYTQGARCWRMGGGPWQASVRLAMLIHEYLLALRLIA